MATTASLSSKPYQCTASNATALYVSSRSIVLESETDGIGWEFASSCRVLLVSRLARVTSTLDNSREVRIVSGLPPYPPPAFIPSSTTDDSAMQCIDAPRGALRENHPAGGQAERIHALHGDPLRKQRTSPLQGEDVCRGPAQLGDDPAHFGLGSTHGTSKSPLVHCAVYHI